MKRSLIFVVTLGLFAGFAGFASTARADYSISVGYNTDRQYSVRNIYYPHVYRHYPRVYYYQPHYPYYPVVVQKNVVYKQASNTGERFGISDVIVLSKAGVNDDIIIEKIRRTGSVFDLGVEEVEALRKEGVSARVVNYMLNTDN